MLWEAVSQTKCCCSRKTKHFAPRQFWAGYATGSTRTAAFYLLNATCHYMRWRKQWPFDFKWTKDNASLIGLCHDYWADCLNQREFHYNRFGVSRVVCGGHLRLLSDGDHTAVNTGARRWWRFSSRTVSLHQARGWTGPKYRYSSFPFWPGRDWNPACQLQFSGTRFRPLSQSSITPLLKSSSQFFYKQRRTLTQRLFQS